MFLLNYVGMHVLHKDLVEQPARLDDQKIYKVKKKKKKKCVTKNIYVGVTL